MKIKFMTIIALAALASGAWAQRAVETVGITESNTLVPAQAAGVIFGALNLPTWMTNTNKPLLIDPFGNVQYTNSKIIFPTAIEVDQNGTYISTMTFASPEFGGILNFEEQRLLFGNYGVSNTWGLSNGHYILKDGVAIEAGTNQFNGSGAIARIKFADGSEYDASGTEAHLKLLNNDRFLKITGGYTNITLYIDASGGFMADYQGSFTAISPTNGLTFWGSNAVSLAAISRTNLGLKWGGLTNTNVEGFRNSLGLGDNDVPNFMGLSIGDGADISSAGFWGNEFGGALSFEEGFLEFFAGTSNRFGLTVGGLYFSNNPTAQANTRTNIGLGASWLTNTNTPLFVQGSNPAAVVSPWIAIGTNVGALQIASNAISGPGSGISFVDNEIWGSFGFHNGIRFIGTNNAAAITRTNIGLGASWLTNSNVPTPYSGAAPPGALLTADGAEGSAFSGIKVKVGAVVLGAGVAEQDVALESTDSVRVMGAKFGGVAYAQSYAFALGWAGGNGLQPGNAAVFRENSTNWGFRYVTSNGCQVNFYASFTNASNYSRVAIIGTQTSNVVEIKPQSDGASVAPKLHVSGLPTNDPGISGVLWNDAGTVKVSP